LAEVGVVTQFTSTARLSGIISAAFVVSVTLAYAATLVVGLLSLPSPQAPIANPMFTIMEVLIIVLMPAIIVLMVAVHAWAPPEAKALSLTALIFMSIAASLTMSLHFLILTLSREAAFAGSPWKRLVFSFEWPSVGYALDIFAWDFWFALSMLFAAPVFRGTRLAAFVRVAALVSGVLAFAGLLGPALGDMRLRNVGLAGYVGAFPFAVGLIAILFCRTRPTDARETAAF
jgi:hypothetical protein